MLNPLHLAASVLPVLVVMGLGFFVAEVVHSVLNPSPNFDPGKVYPRYSAEQLLGLPDK